MYQGYDSERFVLCTVHAVLQCQCGERLVLLGREEDWYTEGRTTFECGGCGRGVTLIDHLEDVRPPALIGGLNEEAENIRDLLRSLKTPFGRG